MPQEVCNGYGVCLIQINENEYMKNEDIECSHNCQPIKCPNFLVCENVLPEQYLYCHHGVCGFCAIHFYGILGKINTPLKYLQFSDNQECPICLETKMCVKQLYCEHKICVDCFKRCHWPPYWNDPEPEFPYDSEDEYDPNDPLVQQYEEAYDKWVSERTERERSESYLKKCPMCRM